MSSATRALNILHVSTHTWPEGCKGFECPMTTLYMLRMTCTPPYDTRAAIRTVEYGVGNAE
eukprot:2961869-Prymnesium_polylepis.2